MDDDPLDFPRLLRNHRFRRKTKTNATEAPRLTIQNPAFANEIKELKKIVQGLGALSYETFQSEVHFLEEEYRAKPQIIPMNRYMAVAAGILLFLVPAITLWYNSQSLNSGEIYALYYAPYQDVVLDRGDDNEVGQKLTKAMQAYNSGDYRIALPWLVEYLDDQS